MLQLAGCRVMHLLPGNGCLADTSNIATEAECAVEMYYQVRLTDLML
jgi:hypothetical protein